MLPWFLGCSKPPAAVDPAPLARTTLTVFAAASLAESFAEIGKKFAADNPEVTVQFSFAGSQQLRAQLESGAQADIFASANEKEMNAAKADSLVQPDTVHDFARNRLVVIYPASNPAKIGTLSDLGRAGVKIDVADVSVPVGKYGQQMVEAMARDPDFGPDFEKCFLANVVSREENVKSVLSKVRLGEADAGVVYVTDVTPDAAKEVASLDVPDQFNQIASYPIAVLAKAPQPDWARRFEDYVLSGDGRNILREHHFLAAPSDGH